MKTREVVLSVDDAARDGDQLQNKIAAPTKPHTSIDNQHDRGTPVSTLTAACNPSDVLLRHYSSWYRLRRSVVWYVKFCKWLRDKNSVTPEVSVVEMTLAERCLIRYIQRSSYSTEYDVLTSGKCLPRKNQLYYLEPTIDGQGIMRVGGRLKYADVDPDAKSQIYYHVITM